MCFFGREREEGERVKDGLKFSKSHYVIQVGLFYTHAGSKKSTSILLGGGPIMGTFATTAVRKIKRIKN